MKRFKRFAAFGISMLLTISMLASCSEEEQADESGVKYRQEGNRITATLGEKLTVDAELVGMPESDAAAVLQVKWDDGMGLEKVEEVLFPGETDLEENSGTVHSPQKNSYLMYDQEGLGMTYTTTALNEKLYEAIVDWEQEGNYRWEISEDFSEDVELDGYSKEQAISDVRDQLEQLGITAEEAPYVIYGLNAETMQSIYEDILASGRLDRLPVQYQNIQYTKEDEAYQMLWHLSIEGIPVLSGNLRSNVVNDNIVSSALENGCLVDVIVTRDQILKLNSFLQYAMTSAGEEEKLLSVGEILASVQDYYSNQNLMRARKVEKISYCYIPVQKDASAEKNSDYDMIPGWCIEVSRESVPGESIYWDVLCVNGITGEIIP